MNSTEIPVVTKHIENGEDEIEIEVAFDFQPPERMTRHYPGCDAAADIYEVTVVETGAEICLLPEVQALMEGELLDDYNDREMGRY